MRGRQGQCGRDLLFGDIKQAREEQDLRTVKMLWINPILKCCNPELQKLKATPVSLWEGSMEMSVLGSGSGIVWLGPGTGDLTFGLGIARPGPPECSRCGGPIPLAGHQALESGLCAGNGMGTEWRRIFSKCIWLIGFDLKDSVGPHVARGRGWNC